MFIPTDDDIVESAYGRRIGKLQWARLTSVAFSAVHGRTLYIDSIEVLLSHHLSYANADTLRSMCDGKMRIEAWPYPRYRVLVRLHQPLRRPEALAFLAACANRHAVHRVDIACDFLTRSQTATDRLRPIVDYHLTERWRGARIMPTSTTATSYQAVTNARRNVAKYSDKRSKVTGDPCVHVEVRYKGTDICTRLGVSTVHDLDSFNPTVVNRHVRLTWLDWYKLSHWLDQSHPHNRSRLARVFECSVHDLSRVPVQRWLDYFRDRPYYDIDALTVHTSLP